MSDSWALDIAREEELIGPSQDDTTSSSFSDSPLVSPESYVYYFGDTEAECSTPGTSDDGKLNVVWCKVLVSRKNTGRLWRFLPILYFFSLHIGYDTACSPDSSKEIPPKKICSTRGRKRKLDDNNEARENKKIKKNGSQRNRKREERYYMEALKRIFIHHDFIAAKTPKRAITHVSVSSYNSFINYSVFIIYSLKLWRLQGWKLKVSSILEYPMLRSNKFVVTFCRSRDNGAEIMMVDQGPIIKLFWGLVKF